MSKFKGLSKRVELAVESVNVGSNNYDAIAEKVEIASVKFNLSEKFIRRVGCFDLTNLNKVVKAYNDGNEKRFETLFEKLGTYDRKRLAELIPIELEVEEAELS